MGKRKANDELVRFVWKRNMQYDIMLLYEMECKNPFGFKTPSIVWKDIAETLQNCPLKMKVTERSCRERAFELLKNHRHKEKKSKSSSGVDEPEMTKLDALLTSVAKLQDRLQSKEVRKIYDRRDKSEADAIRQAAVETINLDDDFEDEFWNAITNNTTDPDPNIVSTSAIAGGESASSETGRNPIATSTSRTPFSLSEIESASNATFNDNITSIHVETGNNCNQNVLPSSVPSGSMPAGSNASQNQRQLRNLDTLHVFFNDKGEEVEEEQLIRSGGSSQKPNSKQSLFRYLEMKSADELNLRKQELQLRKEEIKIKEREIEVKAKEAENKNKELEILLEKTKAETENQKRITDLLFALISRNTQ